MQLSNRVLYSCGVFFAAISMLYTAPASAQSTRTWVSGSGNDANPCTRAAPCQTFGAAHAQTAAGGEINCLDTGGFGPITITKSITIDCTGNFGSILVGPGTSGVLINTPGVTVVLRGLAINGGTPTATGNSGIRFLQGASLTVIDCYISNFTAGSTTVSVGQAINFSPNSSAAELQVVDTVVANSRIGILLAPNGSGSANVTLERATVVNNATFGLRLTTSSNLSTGAFLVARNSTFTGNGTGLSLFTPVGSTFAVAKLVDSTFTASPGIGVSAEGALVRADVSGSTITNNGPGVSATSGAILLSYLDNLVDRNGAGGDGAFTGAVSKR